MPACSLNDCRTLQRCAAELAADRPAPHPLLPTATMGLVVVSCTAKGKQMHGAASVEAELLHAASGGMPMTGVFCDGEIGPQILNARAAACRGGSSDAACEANSRAPRATLQGFTTIVTALSSAPL